MIYHLKISDIYTNDSTRDFLQIHNKNSTFYEDRSQYKFSEAYLH